MSTIFLAVPTVFYLLLNQKFTDGGSAFDNFAIYSLVVSILVVAFYLLSFIYQLGTGRSLFVRKESEEVLDTTSQQSPIGVIVAMLLVVSLVLVGVSEHLVDSLQMLVDGAHLNPLFVGMFLLPLFGSFSEGMVAVKAATSDRMDLAMTSTVESSVQLLLFVLPVLVICGIPMGRYLHLAVPADALFCLGATVLAVHSITENRKLSWYEGSLLLTLYAVIAMGTLLLGN